MIGFLLSSQEAKRMALEAKLHPPQTTMMELNKFSNTVVSSATIALIRQEAGGAYHLTCMVAWLSPPLGTNENCASPQIYLPSSDTSIDCFLSFCQPYPLS